MTDFEDLSPETRRLVRSVLGPRWPRLGEWAPDFDIWSEVDDRLSRTQSLIVGREFATGRALLRQLLGRDIAIPASGDRRPAVPEEWVASLAHDAHVAVAALAPAWRVQALGIDIERKGTLDRDVVDVVVRPDDVVSDPLLAFVLKEASYKAWSAIGGRMLEHHDVHISAESPDATCSAFVATILPDRVELHGRYASSGDAWLALVAVPV